MLFTYLISFILLIDQGLLNILIISQSIHSQHACTHRNETQMRYVGFETIGSKASQIGYNKYIQKETT